MRSKIISRIYYIHLISNIIENRENYLNLFLLLILITALRCIILNKKGREWSWKNCVDRSKSIKWIIVKKGKYKFSGKYFCRNVCWNMMPDRVLSIEKDRRQSITGESRSTQRGHANWSERHVPVSRVPVFETERETLTPRWQNSFQRDNLPIINTKRPTEFLVPLLFYAFYDFHISLTIEKPLLNLLNQTLNRKPCLIFVIFERIRFFKINGKSVIYRSIFHGEKKEKFLTIFPRNLRFILARISKNFHDSLPSSWHFV